MIYSLLMRLQPAAGHLLLHLPLKLIARSAKLTVVAVTSVVNHRVALGLCRCPCSQEQQPEQSPDP